MFHRSSTAAKFRSGGASSLAIVLPLAAIVLGIVTLAALATPRLIELYHLPAHYGWVIVGKTPGRAAIPRSSIPAFALDDAADETSRFTQAINLPAMFTEMAASGIMRSWPDSWRPDRYGPELEGLIRWRALIWPLYCAPFWCIAGIGLDAFLRRRQLRWPALLAGTLFFLVMLLIGIVFWAPDNSGLHDGEQGFPRIGSILWFALSATYPATWIRQFRQSGSPDSAPVRSHTPADG